MPRSVKSGQTEKYTAHDMTRANIRPRFTHRPSAKTPRHPEPAALALIPHALLPAEKRRALLAKARRSKISIDELILSDHHLDEETYYRLVAQRLGTAFSARPQRVIAPDRARDAWQSRIVRLDPALTGKDWLTAPKGPALEQLLTQKLLSNEGFARLLVTTPSALFRSITDSKTETYTDYFSTYLHRTDPQFSCLTLCMKPRRRMMGVLALPVCLVVMQALGIGLTQAVTCFLLPVLLMRILVLATAPSDDVPPADLPDKDLPSYSLLVPLYREDAVIGQLIASLSDLDYPAAKREVLLLIEADDHRTRQALACLILPYGFHVIVLPAGQPRTKPRALNVGLAFASGSLIVVYDAEDRPHPQQLREAARLFSYYGPQTACLQASLVIDNLDESPLAHLFALEYASLFDVMIPRQSQRQWPVPLGGSSNHFRRECLVDAMGWDAWNVTEDADLGLRLYRLGYHIAHLPSLTYEDAPVTLKDWFMQRRRWIKGWFVTSAVHLRHPFTSVKDKGLKTFALLAGQCLSMIGAILLWPLTLFGLPFVMLDESRIWPDACLFLLPLACSLPAILWPLVKGAKKRGHRLPVWIYPALPLYYLLISVAGWVSLYDYLFKPHHWHKTPHKPHG